MAKQQLIEQRATTIAPPEVVYGLLADGSTWPSWSPIGQFELLEAGERVGDQPEGRNAVRLFTTGRTKSRERVVETRPNQVFSYTLEHGMPLRDYKAVVTLTGNGAGTCIEWRSTFFVSRPGTGWIYRTFLGRFIGRSVQGLAQGAAAVVGSGG
jgi:hypothetical protein